MRGERLKADLESDPEIQHRSSINVKQLEIGGSPTSLRDPLTFEVYYDGMEFCAFDFHFMLVGFGDTFDDSVSDLTGIVGDYFSELRRTDDNKMGDDLRLIKSEVMALY